MASFENKAIFSQKMCYFTELISRSIFGQTRLTHFIIISWDLTMVLVLAKFLQPAFAACLWLVSMKLYVICIADFETRMTTVRETFSSRQTINIKL